MSEQQDGRSLGRRRFFRALGTGSVAAAAGAVMGAKDAQAYDPGPEETKARYRETDDVRAFYRTNGYETLRK
ncbi:formate dehydrogenase [Geminicoccus harenae]|uniref:formate dehydrogenase n=1 Tax=Geminicoccus harenae TaxID=2498453 RepID=UPI00168B6C74|nr:formate dehydrogenase [Geminicoccus harenae]